MSAGAGCWYVTEPDHGLSPWCRAVCSAGAQLAALEARLQDAPMPGGRGLVLVLSAASFVDACTTVILHTAGTLLAPADFYSGARLILRAGAAAPRQGALSQRQRGGCLLLQLRLLARLASSLAPRWEGNLRALADSLPPPLLMEWLAEAVRSLKLLQSGSAASGTGRHRRD